MRYTQYLKLEKHIAASDAGGILERWRYGRHLLTDDGRITRNGHLKHGVLAELLGIAAKAGVVLAEREVQRRLQAARTYPTEVEIRLAADGFRLWSDLYNAGFPQVEVPDPGEPYDPRSASDKWRDWDNEQKRRAEDSGMDPLFELPTHFSHDTYGPRTPVSTLVGACDESERYTSNMVKKDAERRSYVNELVAATGGNVGMAWYEAEGRRLGLDGLGLNTWAEFDEIIRDFFGPDGDDPAAE
jgi:hypothetical protein